MNAIAVKNIDEVLKLIDVLRNSGNPILQAKADEIMLELSEDLLKDIRGNRKVINKSLDKIGKILLTFFTNPKVFSEISKHGGDIIKKINDLLDLS